MFAAAAIICYLLALLNPGEISREVVTLLGHAFIAAQLLLMGGLGIGIPWHRREVP